jgi:hypothetical protein
MINHCSSEDGVTILHRILQNFMDQILENWLPVSSFSIISFNSVLQASDVALLYSQQITLGQVHALPDNGMRTFRPRCHTHTQVYVVICKICNIMHLIRHPYFWHPYFQHTIPTHLAVSGRDRILLCMCQKQRTFSASETQLTGQ